MDPISDSTVTESSAPDAGLPTAPELPLSSEGQPTEGGEQKATPQQAQEPGWQDRHSGWQKQRATGWAERQRQKQAELKRYREMETHFTSTNERTQELLKQSIETIRQLRGGEQQVEVPDPALDPGGFQKWLGEQNKAVLQEALGPVLEHINAQKEQAERIAQQEAQEGQEQALVQEQTSYFQQDEQEYAQEQPDLAEGARERFTFGRDLLTDCFKSIGAGESAGHRANQLLFSVAHAAAATGQNRVAALDGFIVSLVNGIASKLGVNIAPGMASAAPNGNGNGHHQANAPQSMQMPNEAARVEQVRRRAGSAGSAAPRLTAPPAPAQHSEARELYQASVRSGNVNWGAIKAAALRDTGGDGVAAAKLINSLSVASR